MPQVQGGGIFVSYRRHESSDFAGRLYDRLAEHFGKDQVFIDVDAIGPGVDFAEAISHAVAACQVLLAVISPNWLTVTDERGSLRLDDPDDIVRLEVEAALARDVRVIPILVEGAVMPGRKDLPKSLRGLARRNAFRIRHESFRPDAKRLITAIAPMLATASAPARKDQAFASLPGSMSGGAAFGPGQTNAPSKRRAATRAGMTPWIPQTQAAELEIDGINSVAFSPDGQLLATGGLEPMVRLWDPATGQQLRALPGHTDRIMSVAFSPDGQLLASASWDPMVRLWDPATGQQRRVLTGHTDDVCSVAFSPDGQLLASAGSGEKTVRLWNPATGQQLRVLTSPKMMLSVVFSPDGRLLATGGVDKRVPLWDPATGQQFRALTGLLGPLAFSPDGQLLAAAGADKTVQLWDPATGQQLRVLTGHTGLVSAGAFSPDGQLLATGGADQTVRLWDPATGQQLGALTGRMGSVSSLAFSADRQLLAVGCNGSIVLWR
jgi:WD40 repeat protein